MAQTKSGSQANNNIGIEPADVTKPYPEINEQCQPSSQTMCSLL